MYISENWAALMEPNLRKVFSDSFADFTSNLPVLFNMAPSTKQVEHDLTTDSKSTWAAKNGDIQYDDTVQGYQTDYTHTPYVSGKKFEKELLDDDQYGRIERETRVMADGARYFREQSGAAIFNNAFSSGTTYGDTVSLCNSAHPSRNDSSLTRSNTGVLALTDANIESVRLLMIKQTLGTRTPAFLNPDMIIAPIDLERTAWEALNSKGKVDTANNNANFHLGKYKLLIWPTFLTGTRRWFMVDSKKMKEYLMWFDRVPVQFFKDRDFGVMASAFAGYMRYSAGTSWPFWIHGNNPA